MDGGEKPELSKHDLKELKKQQKLEQRQQQSSVATTDNKKKRTKQYAITASIVLLAVAGLWFWSSSGITGAASIDIDVGDHPTIGASDAPVSLVVFGDFQCPFTRKFWQGAFPRILEEYGDKVSITYWPVPTSKHKYDFASAEAAYCAEDQGKFWEYAKILFDRQGAAADSNLKDYASELGMDFETFKDCYDSGKYKNKVKDDYREGRKFGVVQTPTVAINENVLSGELPFDDYRTFIDYELTN